METDAMGIVPDQAGKISWTEQELTESRQLLAAFGIGAGAQERLQVCCPGTGRLDSGVSSVCLHNLTQVREKPKYGLIFFTFTEKVRPDSNLIPGLQYCRLLLRPGGRLALLFPGKTDGDLRWLLSAFTPMSRYYALKNYPADLLRSAGFHDVRRLVRRGCGRMVFGSRPASPPARYSPFGD